MKAVVFSTLNLTMAATTAWLVWVLEQDKASSAGPSQKNRWMAQEQQNGVWYLEIVCGVELQPEPAPAR